MHYTHFSDEETEERVSDLPKATQPVSRRARRVVVLASKHSEAQTHSPAPARSDSGGGRDPERKCPPSPTSLPPFAFSVSRWVTEEWGACSRSCGKLGVQIRGVQCLLPLSNGTHKAMPAKACPGDRPEARRPCFRVPCPAQWRMGAWSQVSCFQRAGGAGPGGTFSGESGKRWVWVRNCVLPAGREFLTKFLSPYLI